MSYYQYTVIYYSGEKEIFCIEALNAKQARKILENDAAVDNYDEIKSIHLTDIQHINSDRIK